MKTLKGIVLASAIASTRLNFDMSEMMFDIRSTLDGFNKGFAKSPEVVSQEQFYKMRNRRYELKPGFSADYLFGVSFNF